jgi:exosortase
MAWPAIAFLVFLLPLPQLLDRAAAAPLQSLATDGSVALLKLSGLWVVAEGNVIYVGKQPLEVATACNGLSMLMCLSATVAAAVALVPMAGWLRAILLISAPPIALACNILRIAATAWCYHWYGPEVGGRVAHDVAGWLMMPMAVLLVGLELWLINRLVVVEEVEVRPMLLGNPIADRHALPGPPGEPGQLAESPGRAG